MFDDLKRMQFDQIPGIWRFGDDREGHFDATANHMKVVSYSEDKNKWVVRDKDGVYTGNNNEYVKLNLMN